MKKFYKFEKLEVINKKYGNEIIENMKSIITMLNENYGENRNVDSDLGGYILIAENIVDIEILKKDKLQGLIPEYTDIGVSIK